MSIPMIWRAASAASSGVFASLMPPALPRPPTGTWAFTATGPISRQAAAASSGVRATFPGGMAMPKEARTSLAWYSRSFMREPIVRIGGRAPLSAGFRPLDQPVEDLVEVLGDAVAHHRVEEPAHRADDLDRLAHPGPAAGGLDRAGEVEARERDHRRLQREGVAGPEVDDLHVVVLAGRGVHHALGAELDRRGHVHGGDVGVPLAPVGGVGPDGPDLLGRDRRLS